MLTLISIMKIAKKCQKKRKISRNTLDVDEKHCSNQIVSFMAIIRNIDCYRFLLPLKWTPESGQT